jgi:hypothetical protein
VKPYLDDVIEGHKEIGRDFLSAWENTKEALKRGGDPPSPQLQGVGGNQSIDVSPSVTPKQVETQKPQQHKMEGNGNGGDNRIKEASHKEVREEGTNIATDRVSKNKTSNRAYRKNAGRLEGNLTVNGNKFEVDNKILYTKELDFDDIDVIRLKATDLHGQGHTEYYMLNKLAESLVKKAGAPIDGQYRAITGELKIVSELPFCDSCTDIIQKQWLELFPNTNLVLVNGVRNNMKRK